MWSYAIPLLTAILASLQLVKDWGAHKATWLRASVLLVIVVLGIGGTINAHKNARKADEQAGRIKALTAAVETANANQVQNTKVFTESIERLSTKLSKLETGIKTADLREEADHLRAELAKTQKALITPRAALKAGIVVSPTAPDDPQLFTHVFVPKGKPVSFEISLVNDSGISARSGALALRVCDVCKFHSEPPGFTHPHGQRELERTLSFEGVVAGTNLPTIPIEIDLADNLSQFPIALRCVCENCEDSGWKTATVSVTRLGAREAPVKPR
jgi:hypothetical protein